MKKIIFTIFITINCFSAIAQLDDFGRIALNAYVSDQVNIPAEAKAQLETKLKQIASNYGMGGTTINPRFIVTATISITTKDIIAGPPQMIAQNMDITLFVGDGIENKVFANTIITTKGVGTNENKAVIEAINQINIKNKVIETFLEDAKAKIISYYATQCDFIITKAESLKQQEKYDEAIYSLALVPEVCKDCYVKSLNDMEMIYQFKIDSEGKTLLDKAIAAWATSPNSEGASEAKKYITAIKPQSKYTNDVAKLLKSINSKRFSDEKESIKRAEDSEKRQQELSIINTKQNADLERQRINTYREVAVEYAKNQPKTITYNNIIWR